MVKAFEIPKKRNVDKEAIEETLDNYVEKTSFTVTFEDEDEDSKDASITFRSYIHPLDYGVYAQRVQEVALKVDDTNLQYIDYCGLSLSTHLYIFGALSTMPDMVTEYNDGKVPDVKSIGGYGTFLYEISKDYKELYDSLYDFGYQVCKEHAERFNAVACAMMKGTDIGSLMTTPEILELVKEAVLDAKKSVDK